MPGQPEQRRAAGNRKTRLHQNFVERARLLFQRAARAVCPWLIPERGGADQQRRPGTRPWSQGRQRSARSFGRADGKSQPQSGEAVEFSERAQDHHRQIAAQRDRADGGIDIGKGFVDHQPAAARLQLRSDLRERGAIDDAAVGIVGIDDDSMDARSSGQASRLSIAITG